MRHGRWIVSRKSKGGPRLLSRMQTDLREEGRIRMKGGVAAKTPAGGRLDYFTITDFGVPAYPHPPPEQ